MCSITLGSFADAADEILSPANAAPLNATLRWRERAAGVCLWELESLQDRYRIAIAIDDNGSPPTFTLVIGPKMRPGLSTVYSGILTGRDGHESVSRALSAAVEALAATASADRRPRRSGEGQRGLVTCLDQRGPRQA